MATSAQRLHRMRLRVLHAQQVLVFHAGRGNPQEAMARRIIEDTQRKIKRLEQQQQRSQEDFKHA